MLKKTITQLLSIPNTNIFDGCIDAIELEFGKPVTNLSDLKKREDKKKKGDLWELFCRDWLLASDQYKNVWLFQDWIRYSTEKQSSTMGLKSKQDNGIDIIAELEDGNFVAIQCKYRKDKKKVTWNSLSTFIGLCERTGPWTQYIVMTNGVGVTRKVPKSKKDKSICIGTFRATSRIQWLKMAGLFVEKKLVSETNGKEEQMIDYSPTTSVSSVTESSKKKKTNSMKRPTLDELREIRIKKFSDHCEINKSE